MPKRIVGAFAVAVTIVACGGEEAAAPPPATPPPAPVASAPAPAPTPTAPAEPPPAPKPSLAEMQKTAITNSVAAFNAHDAKKAAADYSDDAVMATPGMKGMEETKGKAEIEKFFAGLFTGFPDMKIGYSRVFQRGDVLVAEWASAGTNTGEFMGQPATGKKIGFNAASIFWFDANGKVKREHVYYDAMTMMGQMGQGDPKMKVRPPAEVPGGEPTWLTAAEDPKTVAAAKGMYEAWEKKDQKAFMDVITDDTVAVMYGEPADQKGKAPAKKAFTEFTKAFPDMKMTTSNQWGFGDIVITEAAGTGTMKGPVMGMKPTNKSGTTHMLDIVEMKDGKVAKIISYSNNLEFAAQYGLLPPPPKAKGEPVKGGKAEPPKGAKGAEPAKPATPGKTEPGKPATPPKAEPAKPATPPKK
ncbi:MAG: ester cyclase [Deltaproteobacteria bacterium]|nr:ester cyclase [Deltaproteobacteria bacterium]